MQASTSETTSQLAAYVAANGSEITIKNRTFTVENVRSEDSLAYFADLSTKRGTRVISYLGMQCEGRVIGRPGAEVWEVVRVSGGCSSVVRFAVYQGALLPL